MSNEEKLRHFLKQVTVDLREARNRIQALESGANEPIAVVGIGCRYPGGIASADDLWAFVADGKDAIGPFPTDRGWNTTELYDPAPGTTGKTYVREGGFVYGAAGFDADFFGISPREATAMDPQQRIALEVTWEAVDHAGIDPHALRNSPTGIFLGATYSGYGHDQTAATDGDGYRLTGTTPSVISGRIAYFLGTHGPAITLDTACSSSLVALHLATRALRTGECSLALAGGVTIISTPDGFIEFSRQRGLAADGRIKAFADAADGTAWGEGAGVLVLEKLSDAERHGHPVLAVVHGSAVNSDGASNGLTAPNGPSQKAVIRAALADAGLTADEVDAVEAHGTGTTLGDPIEARALLETYGASRPADRPLLLGTVKSNLGHTQAAAGAAGLIKMIMAMRHGVLPEILHLDRPTAHVSWSSGGVVPLAEPTPWPDTGRARRAAVSAFGISGTNAHVIVGQAPKQPAAERGDGPIPVPLVLSAKTPAALRAQADRLLSVIDAHDLADVGFSLAVGRSTFGHRAVVPADDVEQARTGLAALRAGETSPHVAEGTAVAGKVVFVLPESPQAGAAELLDASPVFAARLAECAAAVRSMTDRSLISELRTATAPDAVLSWAILVSAAALWRSRGVEPDAVLGRGNTRIAAACIAGALSLEDGARAVCSEGHQEIPGGTIACYATDDLPAEVRSLLDGGHRHFVDLDPAAALVPAIEDVVGTGGTVLGTPHADHVPALAEAYSRGLPVDWSRHFPHGRRVELPPYPFQHRQFWLSSGNAERAEEEWRYRITWEQLITEPAPAPSGTWLLVAPEEAAELGTVTEALTRHDAHTVVLPAPPEPDRDSLADRIREIQRDTVFRGVIALLGDDTVATLSLIQALGDCGIDAPLWCLTRGAVPVGEPVTPTAARVWGLGRVAALEHPNRWGGLVDLPQTLDPVAVTRLCGVLTGDHGEDQVAVRPTGIFARRLVPAAGRSASAERWKPAGTVLITGGTTGLGAHVARWAAREGAEHLLLIARAETEDQAALEAELRELGAGVGVAVCDATDHQALAAAVDAHDGPPIRAVVHADAHREPAPLAATTPAMLRTAIAAKATIAAHLDALFDDEDLDAFVLFSSVAGVWGSGELATYAAASAELDALAERRRARGLTASSIGWGLIDLSGDEPRDGKRTGLGHLPVDPALSAMRHTVERDETAVVVADVDWERFASTFTLSRPSPLLRGIPAANPAPAEQDSVTAAGDAELRRRLEAMPEAGQRAAVLEIVQSATAFVLGHGGVADVASNRPFSDLGFDSLTALELRDRLDTETGLRLPSTLIYDYPTPAALAEQLRTELLGVADDTATTTRTGASTDEPIAIVAMGCRFPGHVRSPEDLWQLVSEGRDAVAEFPSDRGWDVENLYDPARGVVGKSYVRHGGFLDDVADFDPAFFGVNPREALAMDPQQRLLLEISWESLERAGIDPAALRGSDTAVFVGTSIQDYGDRVMRSADEALAGYAGTGNSAAVMSGRVSYAFGFEGPSVTVDTACSSSLVAIHMAVRALRNGESALALAGGVTVMASPVMFIEFSRQGALAADGRSKSFSDDADGTGLAEGAGMLVLERLSDARRNGHPVLAILSGTAINSDGASNGLTAPNGPSQQRVIRNALADAGIGPSEVDLVEAHGTGTALGDPIEAQALLATYGRNRSGHPLRLGSLKSNIGHTQAAAGVAGVMKMVLGIRNGVLPKTLHAAEPSTHVDWSAGTVELVTESLQWPEVDRPRRAGVSSFGISGTNAHVIVEQAPAEEAAVGVAGPAPTAASWLLSAKSEAALRDQADLLRRYVTEHPDRSTIDIAYSLATRSLFEHRAVVIGGRDELTGGLAALAEGAPTDGVVTGIAPPDAKVVFVFPGQGSQWAAMGRELLDSSPVFRAQAQSCAEVFDPLLGWSLLDVLRGAEDAAALDRIDVVQPALFTMMVSLAALWRSYGVEPAAVTGTSQGEIAAAYVAGVLSLEDAARIIGLRSKVLADRLVGRGALASVALSAADAEARIARWDGRLEVGGINSPGLVTVAGDRSALDELTAELDAEGIRVREVPVSVATHCAQVDEIRTELMRILEPIAPREAEIPFYSTVTGALHDAAMDTEYWFANTREPVLFERATRALLADGHTVFIEVSPHPVMGFAVQETVDALDTGVAVLGSLRRERGDPSRFLTSVAEAHVHGVGVRWAAAAAEAGGRRIDLPTYAFQRQRYWLNDDTATADVAAAGQRSLGHPLLPAGLPLAGDGYLVTGRLTSAALPWLPDDSSMVPGVVVELAIRAGDEVGCGRLDALTLDEPLVLPESGGLAVQVSVAAPDAFGRRAIDVHSRAEEALAAMPWTRHATGVLAPEAKPASFDLGEWPPRDTSATGSTWRRGDEIFAEVTLDEADHADAARFGLHPALIDAALSATLGESETPASIRGMSLYATGATTVRIRVTRIDTDTVAVAMADHTGEPLAVIDSLTLRTAPGVRPEVTDGALFDAEWVPLPADADAPAGRWAVLGTDPIGVAAALGTAGIPVNTYETLASLRKALDVPDVVFVPCDPALPTDAATVREETHRTLELARTWLADEHFATSRLAFVTKGATATGTHDDIPDLVHTATWGLIRSAQSENPDRFLLIDLDEAPYPALPAAVTGTEPQLALRNGTIHGRRLRPANRSRPADQTRPADHSEPADRSRATNRSRPAPDSGTADHADATGHSHTADQSRPVIHPSTADHSDPTGRSRTADQSRSAIHPSTTGRSGPTDHSDQADQTRPADQPGSVIHPNTAECSNPATRWHLDPTGTALITGANGTLGGLVARHLVAEHGIRRLLLISRSGTGTTDLEAELADQGATVSTAACDVADRDALAEVLADHPVSAVFHTAGVLDDGVLASLTPQRLDKVLRPKVDGALNLHELTGDLDAFVLFSSSAATFGSPGQSNYAAANTFMDALAQHRVVRGLPATSLGWGFWAQRSGMIGELDHEELENRMRRNGMRPIRPAEGLALMDAGMRSGRAAVLPLRLDAPALHQLAETGLLPPLLRDLVRIPMRRQVDAAAGEDISLRERLAGLTGAERRTALLGLVCETVAAALGYPSADEVAPARAFRDLGFDSLTSVELRNRLNAATGLRLRATVAFDFPSPAAIAEHLAAELFGTAEQTTGGQTTGGQTTGGQTTGGQTTGGQTTGEQGTDDLEPDSAIDDMDLATLVDLALESDGPAPERMA
ncbi:SDR family NAD(P)-dependent oxidoreductase [Nocardia sp. BMG51109]|uniref:SDR family NAD(P)-dependent oxidoreductase n=1 Tax=Nocardia sp. BMG51109 TaxID=1056816 RepID=UPI000464D381|nr:type I polyketide synthase [Nocardia sp. BMG51109]